MHAPPTVVVVDALNFLHTFVPYGAHASPLRVFELTSQYVDEVASAAAKAGYDMIWVFDNGQHTAETTEKWVTRRKQEVVGAQRDMPCSAETMLYAFLQRAKFTVLYPADIDGDDAVCLLAHRLGGVVLSADRDMLRYGLDPSRIFRSFGIDAAGRLHLEPQRAPLPTDVAPRDLDSIETPLPPGVLTKPILDDIWGMRMPTMYTRALAGKARRGNPDALTGSLGNVYLDALPLLAVLYNAILGRGGSVELTLPVGIINASGALVDAALATTTVHANPDEALSGIAAAPARCKAWLETATTWPPTDGDERLLAGRAHAVCMLAAEIACTMRFAENGAQKGSRSPADRIARTYLRLATADKRLNPPKSDACTVATVTAAMAATAINGSGAHHLPRATRCLGLSWNRCAAKCAEGGAGGTAFERSIAIAEKKGKTALCGACVTKLSANLVLVRG